MAQNVNSGHSGAVDPAKQGSKYISGLNSNAVVKRSNSLQKELLNLMKDMEKGISAFPEGDNIFKWIGTIAGPTDTVYMGHKYKLSLEFPDSYPYAPPVVKFMTPCFHPNIDVAGNICLDILKEKWSALYDVRTVLLSIQSLLGEPNNASPLNTQAAVMWDDAANYKIFLDGFYEKNKDK